MTQPKNKSNKIYHQDKFSSWYTRIATVDKMDNVCFSLQILISCFFVTRYHCILLGPDTDFLMTCIRFSFFSVSLLLVTRSTSWPLFLQRHVLIWFEMSLHFIRERSTRKILSLFLKPCHEALFYATEETPKGLQKVFFEIGLPLNVSSTEASSYENTKVAR